MNIETQIRNWAKMILRESYIEESMIPHDEQTLRNSFPKDVSEEKYVPTEEFLETAYEIMNEEFFGNQLPKTERLLFIIKSLPRSNFIGMASYRINRFEQTITPTAITLNSSRTLTLHEWLEVVLHEMVHVCDYVNYPEHFLGYGGRYYDSHGTWFLNYGKQFEKDGFHVQKYCEAVQGINTDDSRVKGRLNGSVFIYLDGYHSKTSQPSVIMISAKDMDKYKRIFTKSVKNGRFTGLKRLVFLKSENSSIIRLKQVRMKNEHSSMSYYYYTDDFKEKYGPFEEIETYDISSSITEDRDEVEFDVMNHIDDEYAKKMYNNIGGIVDIKKKDDETYEVSIA